MPALPRPLGRTHITAALGLVLAVGTALSACSTSGTTTPNGGGDPRIVVTTDIWGDVVSQIVGCGGGSVQVLMPSGADPHDFVPSSAQVAGMRDAQLVIANGLGLESGMHDTLEGLTADGGNVWEIAPLLDPLPFAAAGEPGDEPGNEHGALDPHVWFDLTRMAKAATLIGAELDSLNDGRGRYAACAAQLADSFTSADEQIRGELAAIPNERRILVTDHDALGYFAASYDFKVAGTVIPAGSTLAEPSGRDIADLAATVADLGVPAIFANVAQPQDLAQAVAAESGQQVQVIPLFVEGLGAPGSDAETYLGLMRTNADLIAAGLG